MTSAENGTKVWMTPKRLERGPEAARAELARWGQLPLRPGRLYGSVEQMRAEAKLSREMGKGAAEMKARAWHPTASDIAVGVGAVVGGFFLGRWLVRRHRARLLEQRQTVLGAEERSSVNPYLRGAAALAA